MRGTATAPELQLHLASSRAAAPRSPSPVSSHAGAAMDRKSKSTKGSASSAAAAAASMAALAAAAAAGDSSSDYSGAAADGALPWHGEEDSVPAKMAAVGDASSSSPVAARRGAAASSSSPSPVAARRGVTAAAAVAAGGGGGGPRCQAERCNANLMTDEKPYNRRHKVCEAHSKAPVVLVAGLRQRFCQQCSRFHELSEFDDIKRSCRLRLAGHNERRRKSSADAHGGGNGFRQHADQNGGRGDPAGGNHFQIR